jgi:hypothetical protein
MYKSIHVKIYPDEEEAMSKYLRGEEMTASERMSLKLVLNHLLTHYRAS